MTARTLSDEELKYAAQCMGIAASAFKPEDLIHAFETWLVENTGESPQNRTLQEIMEEDRDDFIYFYVNTLRRVSLRIDESIYSQMQSEPNPLDL